jgi:hypothetical protein
LTSSNHHLLSPLSSLLSPLSISFQHKDIATRHHLTCHQS